MLNSFVEGMSNVLPVEVLSLLDGAELRDLICGNADVDVDSSRISRVSFVHLTGEPKILEASTCACALQFCANCNFVPPVA